MRLVLYHTYMPTTAGAENALIEEQRAALLEERRVLAARREVAALKIQCGLRRRLAKTRVRAIRSIDRSPAVRAQLLKQWKDDRRACVKVGYPVSMLPPRAVAQERMRMQTIVRPWVKPRPVSQPTSPKAGFFLSSLRDSTLSFGADVAVRTGDADSEDSFRSRARIVCASS